MREAAILEKIHNHRHTVMRYRYLTALIRLIRRVMHTYRTCHLSRSAAALSYYLLLALFPMIVCISVLLYRRIPLSPSIGGEAMAWLRVGLESIGGFSWENPEAIPSTVIFAAALTLLLSASAGAFRCLASSASEITELNAAPTLIRDSGARHFTGMLGLVIGYLFATVLFFAVYAAIFLLLLWDELTALIAHHIPANALTDLLSASRYLVLFLLFYALCFGLMRILPPHLRIRCRNADRRSPAAPGALFCTVGLITVTVWFALFIRGSARYSLVYGSLASMILFLTWIFVCGNVLLLGIAVNAAIGRNEQY